MDGLEVIHGGTMRLDNIMGKVNKAPQGVAQLSIESLHFFKENHLPNVVANVQELSGSTS